MIEFDKKEVKSYFDNYWVKYVPDTRKDQVKNFLDSYKLLIDNNNFDDLFRLFEEKTGYVAAVLFNILLLSDIDFMPYMTTIPEEFIQDTPLKSFTVPKNIKSIQPRAFLINRLPNSIVSYEGTKDEWRHLVNSGIELDLSKVKCIDGDITYKFND